MSNSFVNTEIAHTNSNSLMHFKRGIVFCPVCGSQNDFSLITSPDVKDFFCFDCQRSISKHWEEYQKGSLKIIECKLCSSSTFENKKYCINCGREIEGYKPKRMNINLTPKITFIIVIISLMGIQFLIFLILLIIDSPIVMQPGDYGIRIFFGMIIIPFDSLILAGIAYVIHSDIRKRRIKISN